MGFLGYRIQSKHNFKDLRSKVALQIPLKIILAKKMQKIKDG